MAQMGQIISNEKISTTDIENTALFLKSQRVYKVRDTCNARNAATAQLTYRDLDLIRSI
jgi:hypothetical protein